MKLYPIYTRKLVIFLEENGFKVIHMEPNTSNPNLMVYFFEETPALRQAVQEFRNKAFKLDYNNLEIKSTNQNKPYIIYTWTLANKLYERGFKPLGKQLNTKDPTHDVILFEDTPALRQAIKELTQKG